MYLEQVRTFRSIDDVHFDAPPIAGVLSRWDSTAAFYDTDRVDLYDVFKRGGAEYIKIFLPRSSEVGQWFEQYPVPPVSITEFMAPDLMEKYLFPQMVTRHFWFSPKTPLAWELMDYPAGRDWLIGRS